MMSASIFRQNLSSQKDEDYQLIESSYNLHAYHSSGACAVLLGHLLDLKLFNSHTYNEKSWNKTSFCKTGVRIALTCLLMLPTTSALRPINSSFRSNYFNEFICVFLLFAFVKQMFGKIGLVKGITLDGEMELGEVSATNISRI